MKALKWIGIIIGILIIAGYFGMDYMKAQTKKASPEEIVVFEQNGLKMSVFYCRPYKKEREIFGALVPYDEIWRTGANEATTFETNKAIIFGDQEIKAGKYTLWTIPNEKEWNVILNSKMYDWGVGFGAGAAREAKYDVANVSVPAKNTTEVIEQLKISFLNDATLAIQWDETQINVPISLFSSN